MEMKDKVVLHKGYYWPINDGSQPITSDYAHTDSTCYHLMNIFPNIPSVVSSYAVQKRVIVQAGGNAGFYVKQYAEMFEKVYTFEPDPVSFYCLNLNVTTPNVFKYQACLGNEHKCVKLNNTYYSQGEGHGGSHVILNQEGSETPNFKIDDLNLSICDLIHLDIEGFEKFAILGAIDTIVKCKPVIVIEDFAPWKERYDSNLGQIEELLFAMGYKFIDKVTGDTDRVYKHESQCSVAINLVYT